MAAFEYLALDDNGRARKGVLTGDSPRHVRAQLRDQGLSPVEVHVLEKWDKTRGFSLARRSIPVSSLAIMTRQLATLVRAGMPIEESLRVLEEQVNIPRLQSVVAGLRSHITEGSTLSEALSRYPAVFPEFYWTMVEAGEASGQLDEILDRLADYTEQQQELRQRIAVAMIYPVILTAVALTVVTALLTYVVPEVVRVFNQTGQELPALTRWLISFSDFVRSYGLYLLACFTLACFVASSLVKRPGLRFRWDGFLLRLPLIGDLVRTVNSARLARILAILTRSGVTLMEALRIGTQVVRNVPVRKSLEEAMVALREGGRFHRAMRQSGLFPPLLTHMVSVGEESGELEKMLDKAAGHYERELKTMITAVTSMLEPVLILLMGGIVLVIVLAILLPIFEMNQLVGL